MIFVHLTIQYMARKCVSNFFRGIKNIVNSKRENTAIAYSKRKFIPMKNKKNIGIKATNTDQQLLDMRHMMIMTFTLQRNIELSKINY